MPSKKHLLALATIILSSLVAICSATAEPSTTTNQKWYQVEIIIFSQIPYGEKQEEMWPLVPALSLPSQTISLIPPNIYQLQQQPNSYPLVPENSFLLTKEGAHIFNNPNYKMIGHLAWLQPLSTQQTSPTYIQAANNQSSVDTLVSLQYKRYIQLNLQAIMTTNISAFSSEFSELKTLNNNGVIRFILHRSIRMKMNELNYIDSPFFGILLKVTPHAAPNLPIKLANTP